MHADHYAEQTALDACIRVTGNWFRYFLVTRKPDIGLMSIQAFDSPSKAARAKVKADAKPLRRFQQTRDSVCLFAGPDLATVVVHHPSWFDATAEFVGMTRSPLAPGSADQEGGPDA